MGDIFDGMGEDERAALIKMCEDVQSANTGKSQSELVQILQTAFLELLSSWKKAFAPFLSLFPHKRKKYRRPIMCNRSNHVGETHPGRSIKARS